MSELNLPFFDQRHRALSNDLHTWASANITDNHSHDRAVVDQHCKDLVQALGAAGWLKYAVAGMAYGGAADTIDTRSLCLHRDTLAQYSGLADFAFAMQGLGSGAISLFGTEAQKSEWLPKVARGEAIAAFALSEKEAGSDVAAMQCAAELVTSKDGDYYVLNGHKTWISNGGIADFYVVFARMGNGSVCEKASEKSRGTKGISAFIVPKDAAGFAVTERIDVIAPHPLATIHFTHCKIPATNLIGTSGEGFKVAMATLDVFRTSVAAAALGFARRALQLALLRSTQRPMLGGALSDLQLTQSKLGQMATELEAASLLTYKAAWLRDQITSGLQTGSITKDAAMAKLYATEAAQSIIDQSLQLHGGLGVKSGEPIESLYREIRALRIYEGASEVQQLIIARELLKGFKP